MSSRKRLMTEAALALVALLASLRTVWLGCGPDGWLHGIVFASIFIMVPFVVLGFNLVVLLVSLPVAESFSGLADQFASALRSAQRKCGGFSFRSLTLRARPERLVSRAGWLIPRNQREQVIGDLLEDIADLRNQKISEWRIWLFVLWQLQCTACGRLLGLLGWAVALVKWIVP